MEEFQHAVEQQELNSEELGVGGREVLVRSHATFGGKQPRVVDPDDEPSSSSSGDDVDHDPITVIPYGSEPDIQGYFDAFGTDVWTRIRQCRTYANFLAASTKGGVKRRKKE